MYVNAVVTNKVGVSFCKAMAVANISSLQI
jgi:hypothetical protein